MKHLKGILFLFVLLLLCSKVNSQDKDSVRVYWLNPVEVNSNRLIQGDEAFPIEKDRLSSVLNKNGFTLIRKGVFFAQDIYSDGFKKSDINVVVDGERYHSACPNRMDSPLIRVNPIELEKVDLMKTSGSLQSGLAGVVSFNRSDVGTPLKVKTGLSGTADASQYFDGAVLIEGYNNRVTLRYATGKPYDDADGRSFKENYNYKSIKNFTLGEVSFSGKQDKIKYGAAFSYADDISFPYLLMDERATRIYSSHISYDNNKLYFNYTDHNMDNSFRNSMMNMNARTKNLTVGLVGKNYEVYFRDWQADNKMVMLNMAMENEGFVDVKLVSAAVQKKWDFGSFYVSSKAGLVGSFLNDESKLDFFRALYSDVEDNRIFPTFGVAASYTKAINSNWGTGIMLEAASEAPDVDALYVNVNKPMQKPNWSGNPTLDQPVRATLRGSLNYNKIRLEVYGTNVWNYVNLSKSTVGNKPYLTYKNVNANMLGFNLNGSYKFAEVNASYTFAENTSDDNPLSEIPPLQVTTTLKSPELKGFTGFLKHTYSDAQTRVDLNVDETTTPAWNKVDLGISYLYDNTRFSLEIENVTNELYYQHLSYRRDPFASGMRVFEPGRVIRFSIRYN